MTESPPAGDQLDLPDGALRLVESGTSGLLHELDALTDEQAREPSLLPGWTRGHTLTHIARNADGLANLLTWARTGEEHPMYPSREARDAAIQEGSGRTADELRADIIATHERFMATAAELAEADWGHEIVWGAAQKRAAARMVPFLRLTEVEVHHVDVGLGHTPAHWPAPFVSQLLGTRVAELSERDDLEPFRLRTNDGPSSYAVRDDTGPVVSGPQAALLAWTIGRTNGEGLSIEPEAELPQLGAWR